MGDFSEKLLALLKADRRFEGCRFIRSDRAMEVAYPLKAPLVCVGREEFDRLGFLIGSEDCLFGSEKLTVSVATDEKLGGAYCEELARGICRGILEADSGRDIIAVSVEKCMYDRSLFAYKVIMGFTLSERCC